MSSRSKDNDAEQSVTEFWVDLRSDLKLGPHLRLTTENVGLDLDQFLLQTVLCWFVFQGDVQERAECSVEDTVLICELGNPFKSNQEVQNVVGTASTMVCNTPAETDTPSPEFQVQVLIIFQPSEISLDIEEILSLLQLST